MRYLIYCILIGFLSGGVLMVQHATAERPSTSGSSGAQTKPTPKEPPPSQTPPADETRQSPSEKEDTEDELGTFTPSEKVPADSAISFPVDI
jgi:cytoskeletal protein RodZ